MPETLPATPVVHLVHEAFCLPRPNADGPRIEVFTSYVDDVNGRSRAAFRTTRCIECGASTNVPI